MTVTLYRIILILVISSAYTGVAQTFDDAKRRADQGDAEYQAIVSEMIRRNEATGSDDAVAYKYAQESSLRKHPLGMFNLAECLNIGIGTVRDTRRARALYAQCLDGLRDMAMRNNARAEYAIAKMYESGNGVNVNEDSSRAYIERAAKHGYAPAQYTYGRRLLSQALSQTDTTIAMAYIETSVEAKYAPAMVAKAFFIGGRDTVKQREAFLLVRNAAALGFPLAEYVTGAYYYSGTGVQRDTVESLKWFLRAAAHKHEVVFGELGYRTLMGAGIPRDTVQSLSWFLVTLALSEESREKLIPFATNYCDILMTDASRSTKAAELAIKFIRQVQHYYDAAMDMDNLSGNQRKVWQRRMLDTSAVSGIEYIGFARNGALRMVVANDTSGSVDGTWRMTEKGLLLSIEGRQETVYKAEIISPGLLVLRDGMGDEYMIFEQCKPSSLSKSGYFGSQKKMWSEPSVRLTKSDVQSDGVITLTFTVDNVPTDGLNIDLFGYSIKDGADEMEKNIEPDFLKGEPWIYENGTYTFTWNAAAQLKQGKDYDKMRVYYNVGYNMDARYRFQTDKTPVLKLSARKKKER
ncbi:MAG: sel1 repeat family protein [Candidatus Kapabacteria bacterium]|nr:sel1 repeat family protein [Candidatus Kapabacteria bacterium]